MPRGKKSKLRAREKRRQVQSEAQSLEGAQAPAAEGGEAPSAPPAGGSAPSSPAPGPSQEPQGATATSSPAAGVSGPRSDARAESQGPASARADGARRSPLDQKAVLLAQFMVTKHSMQKPITKEDMMKHVIQKHKRYFQEILKRASELTVLAFGLDVQEVDPARHCYALVSKLHHSGDGGPRGDIVPKKGLLMTILCVIFMKGNRAPEGDIWEVLNVMGIHAGQRHSIHGEPTKLIKEDLVREGYLEYRRVAGSEPPRHEFLWGPRARAETSKMEVLQFLAKLHDTQPSAFPLWYEEAMQEELERTRRRFAALARTGAPASVLSRVDLSSSHLY